MTIDRRKALTLGAAALLSGAVKREAAAPPVTKPEQNSISALLQAQTQELLDAIVPGKLPVWEKYVHEGCVYTAEDGQVSDRKALLDQIKPMPAGVTGDIRVIHFKARIRGPVAIATYVSDEHEDYHGHKLHCQYRSTDTWWKTAAGWRLLSSQVLALRTDPPAIALAPAKADEYCGHYALSPDISYEIRRKDDGLEGQQAGRDAKDLRAEAPDVLFTPGRPRYRYIFQRDPAGRITAFAERREAWDLLWTRV